MRKTYIYLFVCLFVFWSLILLSMILEAIFWDRMRRDVGEDTNLLSCS